MNTPRHVILVDDNADVRLHLGNLLTQMGFGVETVDLPTKLMRRTQWPRRAVLLLDMRMPELTGLELQRFLARHSLEMPVIFISGESQPQEIVDAMKAGAVDFLIKPFGLEELTAALDRAFERSREQAVVAARIAELRGLCAGLSTRECAVLRLLLQGHSNRSASQLLSVQADTIKKHRAAIYEKLLVADLSDLMALFAPVHDLNAVLPQDR